MNRRRYALDGRYTLGYNKCSLRRSSLVCRNLVSLPHCAQVSGLYEDFKTLYCKLTVTKRLVQELGVGERVPISHIAESIQANIPYPFKSTDKYPNN